MNASATRVVSFVSKDVSERDIARASTRETCPPPWKDRQQHRDFTDVHTIEVYAWSARIVPRLSVVTVLTDTLLTLPKYRSVTPNLGLSQKPNG